MKTSLYQNIKGYPVTRHSYSAGETFRSCRRKYFLDRIEGWKERDKKASLEFGKCIEDAIEHYHRSGMPPGLAVGRFRFLWTDQKEEPLVYTDKEGDWDDLLQMGTEMLALYEIKFPTFGISDLRFQLQYRKEVFPESHLAGLEFTAYVDLLAHFDPCVPDTPDIPIIVDIKTAAHPYPDDPNLLKLDGQLAAYSWVSGVEHVAFLVLVKARPGSYKKGDEVTILQQNTGRVGEVAYVTEASDTAVTVLPQSLVAGYLEQTKGLRGKALAAAKTKSDPYTLTLLTESVTKQRIQFIHGVVPEEHRRDAGIAIGDDIAAIVSARERKHYPREGGIRFPNNKCLWCQMLPICSGDDAARDEKLVQIGGR